MEKPALKPLVVEKPSYIYKDGKLRVTMCPYISTGDTGWVLEPLFWAQRSSQDWVLNVLRSRAGTARF